MQDVSAKTKLSAAPDIYSKMMIDISALIFSHTKQQAHEEHLFVFIIILQERLFDFFIPKE